MDATNDYVEELYGETNNNLKKIGRAWNEVNQPTSMSELNANWSDADGYWKQFNKVTNDILNEGVKRPSYEANLFNRVEQQELFEKRTRNRLLNFKESHYSGETRIFVEEDSSVMMVSYDEAIREVGSKKITIITRKQEGGFKSGKLRQHTIQTTTLTLLQQAM